MANKSSNVPIVGGKPYDPEDDFEDSVSRGIKEGIRRSKERERKEADAKSIKKRKRR